MKYPSAISYASIRLGLLAAAMLTLSACTERSLPPCPNIFALTPARTLDHFQPGKGRDPTDVDFHARIDSWKGSCGFKPHGDDWDVDLDLKLGFTVTRGPANRTAAAKVDYFVAIPAFFPKAEGKTVFPLSVTFPPGVDTVTVTDGPVYVTFPMHTNDVIDTFTIYLGFQESKEEIEHNLRAN